MDKKQRLWIGITFIVLFFSGYLIGYLENFEDNNDSCIENNTLLEIINNQKVIMDGQDYILSNTRGIGNILIGWIEDNITITRYPMIEFNPNELLIYHPIDEVEEVE